MSCARLSWCGPLVALALTLAASCAPPAPVGCRVDADCPGGASCDAGACVARPVATIDSLTTDQAAITSGTRAGALVQGTAHLAWHVTGASRIVLLAGQTPLDLTACEPTAPATTCEEAGSVAVTPSATTTYTLLAGTGSEPCAVGAAGCVSATVDVAVLPPAQIALSTSSTSVNAGDDVTVSYLASGAASLTVGVILVEGGVRRLEPCAVAGDGTPSPACTVAGQGAGAPQSGQITFANVQSPFTVAATAKNGADDGLGDVPEGSVELAINVAGAPSVASFVASDATVRAGDAVGLSWVVNGGDSVSIVASPASAVAAGLGACTGVDAGSGGGSCAITLSNGLQPQFVILTLIAHGTLDSPPVSTVIQIGEAPNPAIAASPAELPRSGWHRAHHLDCGSRGRGAVARGRRGRRGQQHGPGSGPVHRRDAEPV